MSEIENKRNIGIGGSVENSVVISGDGNIININTNEKAQTDKENNQNKQPDSFESKIFGKKPLLLLIILIDYYIAIYLIIYGIFTYKVYRLKENIAKTTNNIDEVKKILSKIPSLQKNILIPNFPSDELKEEIVKWKGHLDGVNLNGIDLTEADLREANLKNANLINANLSGASLQNANLEGAQLHAAKLNISNKKRTDLSKANLTDAQLDDCELKGADLFKAKLIRARLISADLSKANLNKADLSEANLDGVNLNNALWSIEQLNAAKRPISVKCGDDKECKVKIQSL